MNSLITANLFGFWTQVGQLAELLVETENYRAIATKHADWPNRIFNFNHTPDATEEIRRLHRAGKLPGRVTIEASGHFTGQAGFERVLVQKNMALDLTAVPSSFIANARTKQVESPEDAVAFAETASRSFGYSVDHRVILKIARSETIRLFLYEANGNHLACGCLYFDSNNNAGLHLIGTVPEARQKGIGRRVTEHLIAETQKANKKFCVLNASAMGEPIYRKLGFQVYGEIETYKILL